MISPNFLDKLSDAAFDGNLDLVIKLIEQGAKVNQVGSNKTTALISAARRQNTSIVKWLLDHGADPNITVTVVNEDGYIDNWTALMASTCLADNPIIVKMLIEKGADVNIVNSNNETSLDLALKYKRTEIAKLLRQVGGQTIKNNTYKA